MVEKDRGHIRGVPLRRRRIPVRARPVASLHRDHRGVRRGHQRCSHVRWAGAARHPTQLVGNRGDRTVENEACEGRQNQGHISLIGAAQPDRSHQRIATYATAVRMDRGQLADDAVHHNRGKPATRVLVLIAALVYHATWKVVFNAVGRAGFRVEGEE